MNVTSLAPIQGYNPAFPRLHCTSQIVIPARLASTRLPEKLLLRETGKTVLQHTYEAALKASRPSRHHHCRRLRKAAVYRSWFWWSRR